MIFCFPDFFFLHSQILLDNRETLKLSDFTLAQSLEDSVEDRVKYDFTRSAQAAFGEGSSRSKTEQRKGGVAVIDTVPSPFYAAPELYEDGGRFDKATDLWSLGVLTYELCTGEAERTLQSYIGAYGHQPECIIN